MKIGKLEKKIQAFIIIIIIVNVSSNHFNLKSHDNENVDDSVKDHIVNKINDFRNKVANGIFEFEMTKDQKAQLATMKDMYFYSSEGTAASPTRGKLPPGKNLNRVYWDNQLHSKAETWVKQCKKSYPDDISSGKIKYGLISKMHYFKNQQPKKHDWKNVIDEWVNEISSSKFDLKNIDSYSFEGKAKSVIAQLLFSDLDKIGCSSFDCGKGKHRGSTETLYKVLFVCYLFPQGPHQGKQIYDRARSKDEVGKIKCKSNGSNTPYMYLCPKNTT